MAEERKLKMAEKGELSKLIEDANPPINTSTKNQPSSSEQSSNNASNITNERSLSLIPNKHRYAFENYIEGINRFNKVQQINQAWEIAYSKTKPSLRMFPLHYATMGYSYDAAESLIKEAIYKDASCKDMQPFHALALYGAWKTRESNRGERADPKSREDKLEDFIKLFKDHNMDIDHSNKNFTPLGFACLQNNLKIAQSLVESGANVNCNSKDMQNIRPLHLACEYNNDEIVEYLIGLNAETGISDDNLNTALHYATQCKNETIFELIAEKMIADTNLKPIIFQKNNEQITCLQLAIEHKRNKIIAYLLKKFPNSKEIKDNIKEALLPHIVAKNGYCEIFNSLYVYDNRIIKYRDVDGNTPFHIAALNNKTGIIEYMLKIGADQESNNDIGYTPLLCAAFNDNIDVFKILWKSCLHTKISFVGDSVIMIAVKRDAIKCLKFMLDNEEFEQKEKDLITPIVTLPNLHLDSPLHAVAETGNMEIFKLLINYYGNINIRNRELQTPLYLSVLHQNIDILKELLKISRCSVNLKDRNNLEDKNNITPLILAVQNDSSSIIEILLENEKKFYPKTNVDIMALKEAIKKGNLDIVKFLINPNHIRNPNDIYPLHVAVEHKQLSAIEFLLTNELITKDKLDAKNMTCLELALEKAKTEEGYEECVRVILEVVFDPQAGPSEKQELMNLMRRREDHSKKDRNSPIQTMILDMPQIASFVFDKCITITERGKKKTYNYELIEDMYYIPGEKINSPYNREKEWAVLKSEATKRADFNEIITTHPLALMRDNKRYDLLSHELVSSYLRLKWNRNARRFYYLICILYATLVMSLSLIIFENADRCYHISDIEPKPIIKPVYCETTCNITTPVYCETTCNITTLEDSSPKYKNAIENNSTYENTTYSCIFIEVYNVEIAECSWGLWTFIPCLIKLLLKLLLYASPIYIGLFILLKLFFTIWRIKPTSLKLGTIFDLLMCFLTLSLIYYEILMSYIENSKSRLNNKAIVVYRTFMDIGVVISFTIIWVTIKKFGFKIFLALIFLFIIIGYVIICLLKSKEEPYLTWQCDLLLLVNLLAWIHLFKLVRKLPRFGVYVLIVWNTIKTFLRMIPLFLLFIIPFSISFFVMLAASEKGLLNLVQRIFHTIVFLLAEFDYADNIAEKGFWLTYLIFFLYLFIGTVFLMNLLTGIAVIDVSEALEDAANKRICLEIDVIFDVESILYSLSVSKIFKRFSYIRNLPIKLSAGNEVIHIDIEEKKGSWNFKKICKKFGLTKELSKNENITNEKLDAIADKLNKLEEQMQKFAAIIENNKIS